MDCRSQNFPSPLEQRRTLQDRVFHHGADTYDIVVPFNNLQLRNFQQIDDQGGHNELLLHLDEQVCAAGNQLRMGFMLLQ